MNKQDSPALRILAGDSWYTVDQIQAQMRTRGRRRVIERRWQVYDSMMATWLSQRPGSSIRSVLDAGCGDGLNLVGLHTIAARHQWPLRLMAVDYNPLRVGRATQQFADVAAQRASLRALPYITGSFDVVLCSHVLEHIPVPEQALAELHRVLIPGGLLIVAVPNEGCAMGRLRNNVLQRHVGRTTDHVNFFTAPTLTRSLEAVRFRVASLERETFFFPITYLNMACNEFTAGHALMDLLRTWLPSQSGGLIVAAVADGAE
jgi:SAM-dependent methyltransferase